MMKFIHAADVHLDSPLQGLEQYEGAPTTEIRAATRHALENLVRLAIEEEVDFLLIAGDLYDGDWKDHNTGLFFVSQMRKLREANIPVVAISGNHDAANKMTKSLPLPENVELLSSRKAATAKHPQLAQLGVAIHGRSFASAVEQDNLARSYPEAKTGCFNIGLLHTSLTGRPGHARYAPCSIEELRQKGYDYWALGHVHQREVVCEEPYVVYPGNLQGRHIRETGSKGCYLATVDDQGRVQLDFHSLDVFRWDLCELDLGKAEHPQEVLELLSANLRDVLARHADLPLAIRVVIGGVTPPHQELVANATAWKHNIRSCALDVSGGRVWIEKIKFETTSPRSNSSGSVGAGGSVGDGPLGELLAYLEELRGNEELLLSLQATYADLRRDLPDQLVHGDDALQLDDAEGVRQILNQIEPLLIQRLTEGAAE